MSTENQPSNTPTAKNDDLLLTVIARGATKASRKLLKEYGQEDAKNHKDLEEKLADLYLRAPDKIEIEKKLAAIHPHRAWLMKYELPKKEEPKVIVEEIKKEEKKSGCDGCSNMCGSKRFSNFDAAPAPVVVPQPKDHTPLYLISMVAIFGILTLHIKK